MANGSSGAGVNLLLAPIVNDAGAGGARLPGSSQPPQIRTSPDGRGTALCAMRGSSEASGDSGEALRGGIEKLREGDRLAADALTACH